MTDFDNPIFCLHCGQSFPTVERVRHHQALAIIAATEPQILEWTLETNMITGEWE